MPVFSNFVRVHPVVGLNRIHITTHKHTHTSQRYSRYST